jgi:hypothetical protein
MAKLLTQIRDSVKKYVQDQDSNLNSEDYDDAIERAALALSRRNPYQLFETFTGTGSAYEWSLSKTNYINGLSTIASVVWPWETDDAWDPISPLESWDYLTYEKTAGVWYFKLKGISPSSSEYVRVYYTSKHTITDTASTITSPDHEFSVIVLAAAFCLQMLAARAIAVGNSTLGADTVSYQTRSAEYASRAKDLIAQSGLKGYMDAPASGFCGFYSMGESTDTSDLTVTNL